MRDATFGAIALAVLTSLFVYYTVWALVTPLIDAGHPVLAYFPKHSDAVARANLSSNARAHIAVVPAPLASQP